VDGDLGDGGLGLRVLAPRQLLAAHADSHRAQRADGRFQVHCWHQDDDFCAPDPAAPHAAELWALLHAVMRRLEHAASAAPVESLSELIEALDSGGEPSDRASLRR
jgi:hypothetical protein